MARKAFQRTQKNTSEQPCEYAPFNLKNMDYEKKYNDAMARCELIARTGLKFNPEYIFPELRESEDERMMRMIGLALTDVPEERFTSLGTTLKDCLAYLEKQKEQPISAEEVLTRAGLKPYKDGNQWCILVGDNIQEGICGFGDTIEDALYEFLKEVLDFQKKQKPALTPERIHPKFAVGDTVCRPMWSDHTIREIYVRCNDPVYVCVNEEGTESHISFSEQDEWERKEQKPAEWSEEDEKTIWGFTAWVPNEELERLGVTRDDILKKLKSLRSNPIQLKEAYIDGFDTARHATALAFMNYCDKIRPNGKMCLSNGECEDIEKAFLVGDWEKIERYFHKYQWKPTEEQMEALKLSFEEAFDDAGDCNRYRRLKSLYEELLKL